MQRVGGRQDLARRCLLFLPIGAQIALQLSELLQPKFLLACYSAPLLTPCASPHPIPPQEFQQRHGLRACMVAPTKIIAGLGMSLGIEVLEAPGTTGDYRTLFHK